MRRHAGRRPRTVVEIIHESGIEPMSMEEIDAEVKAVRAERRARKGQSPGADRS